MDKQDLTHGEFIDIAATKRRFVEVDFSFSRFYRAYFRGAIFERCRFTGCRFEECNLRNAQFIQCDFKYTYFDKTIVPQKEIIANAPEWPNAKRDLMQILRANAETVGDYEAQKAFIREQMLASREHLRRARKRQDSYYRDKYRGAKVWCSIRSQSVKLWFDRQVLGHGEHLGRAALGSTGILLVLAFILFLNTQTWEDDPTASSLVRHLWLCVQYVLYTLLGAPTDIRLGEPKIFVVIILLLRYFLLGVLVAALWRHVSHR